MIFVSYSWKDRASTEIVEATLERMGLVYWIDHKNLNLNHRLQPQILRAIRKSRQLLCIESKASRVSPWVRYELKAAIKHGKRILELDANHKHLDPNNALHADRLLASLLIHR